MKFEIDDKTGMIKDERQLEQILQAVKRTQDKYQLQKDVLQISTKYRCRECDTPFIPEKNSAELPICIDCAY